MVVNRSVPSAQVIPLFAYDEVAQANDWLLFSQSIADVDPASWGATSINLG